LQTHDVERQRRRNVLGARESGLSIHGAAA
jgi:hypothetical protein